MIEKRLKLKVANLGRDGAKTLYFLREDKLSKIKSVDAKYYIICLGLNERKFSSVNELEASTRDLIEFIKSCTSGIPILMTNISSYYPPSFGLSYDQSSQIPFEEMKRKISKELNIPLIDVFARFEKEALSGNWDTRIRNQQVFDSSQDEGKTIESGWFDDIHYNVEGNRIVADEIIRYFKENIL